MIVRTEIADAVAELAKEGGELVAEAAKAQEVRIVLIGPRYQVWYTKCLQLVRVLAPDRLKEFVAYYERDSKRKALTALNFTLQDFFLGISPVGQDNITTLAAMQLLHQKEIVEALASRIDGLFANLEAAIASEVYDREIAGARTLLKASPRAAGVIAGVVLEDHLQKVCTAHQITIKKRKPVLSDLNDAAKDAGLYGTATWRKVQYLADIRNLCAHKKGTDPTAVQVEDLVSGVEAFIKSVV